MNLERTNTQQVVVLQLFNVGGEYACPQRDCTYTTADPETIPQRHFRACRIFKEFLVAEQLKLQSFDILYKDNGAEAMMSSVPVIKSVGGVKKPIRKSDTAIQAFGSNVTTFPQFKKYAG